MDRQGNGIHAYPSTFVPPAWLYSPAAKCEMPAVYPELDGWVGIADLTVFLFDQGRLSYDEAVAMVKRLRCSEKQKRDAMVALEILARERGGRDGAK